MFLTFNYQKTLYIVNRFEVDMCQVLPALFIFTVSFLLCVKDAMPVSFRSELFTSYMSTIFKQ